MSDLPDEIEFFLFIVFTCNLLSVRLIDHQFSHGEFADIKSNNNLNNFT